MRICILGATGMSGLQLVEEALQQGHQVIAVVRSPEKIAMKHSRLEIKLASVFFEAELTPLFRGCDAVVSCLGQELTPWILFSRITFFTDSIYAIVPAMRKAGVTRLVVITSWCTVYKPDNPWHVEWLLKPLLFGRIVYNMSEMEAYLEEHCPDINYTFVKPPLLNNNPTCGRPPIAVEDQFVPGGSERMSRRDLVKFMLYCLTTDTWDRKGVAIASPANQASPQ